MGRPKRQPDEELSTEIQDLVVVAGGSLRRVALALEITPTTLARSLEKRAFSKGTRQRIERKIEVARGELTCPKSQSKDGAKSSEQMLQIVHKLSTLLSEAVAELQVAKAQLDSLESTAPGQIR
jgi:hypothetical protein